ncbi:hypothetical protein A3K01_00230 [candidate division WWE3 bacterium RIFOXYD1_FULL_43_17]|uniref:Uncharacterized protein n=3 Tax=Katanobacteria TaxID=422282 RepID=A0A1F4XC01_UNCKA|nr:MAG: hypothetical protein UU59_C0005G0022 [candidate division WWE3 bacterium GW2011_GWE1_41_27]KKS60689.1 MAG: hypothetical protein UV26_C0002G0015 [candidate division WWE3 bacterium GW2011_GWF2_42_42]OGC79215.1 MAG: hypothetical protein A3K01_00230 [candidate division WWE3 bacterium RIFOXYD1_FULL_43_17]
MTEDGNNLKKGKILGKYVGPFDHFGDFEMILELTELKNIRNDGQNKVIADVVVVEIPEGTLFIHRTRTIRWVEEKNGFPVDVELVPAFYNSKRAWYLLEVYQDENWESKRPEEWFDDEKILTYEQGLQLHEAHI